MPIDVANRYPRPVILRDESKVTLRPMSRADASTLVDFFRAVPESERFFLKDDVTSPGLIQGWIENLNYDYALPILALDEHRVVGDAVLIRHRSASLQHSGEIRIVIDPGFRNKGLAVAMMTDLVDVAKRAGLEEVVFEFVHGPQTPAIEAAKFLGATEAGELKDWVRDEKNRGHNVVFLKLKL
ncbi:MAG: GNAT family N-acetyltransferase [bacterium]